MFQRLRTSCSYGYSKNPHLLASLSGLMTVSTLMMSTLCCVTLIQAALRSTSGLEIGPGNSDYAWSVPLILATQIPTVTLGYSAVIYRCTTMFKYLKDSLSSSPDEEVDDVIQRNPVLGITSRFTKYARIIRYSFLTAMDRMEIVIGIIPAAIFIIFYLITEDEYAYDAHSAEWVEKKSKEDAERWIDQNKSEPSTPLFQLLISQNYPYHQFDTLEVIDPSLPDQKGVYVSSLSLVLLVRIAQVSLPESPFRSLVQAFNEVKEVFYYTEKNIYPTSSENDNRLLFAKSVWSGQEFNILFPEIFDTTINPQTHSDLGRALSIIRQLKAILPSDPVWDELGIIVDFINSKTYSTIQELATSVEQLFVDMVRVMLSQIPQAIFKSLNNSTDEKYEENVKIALKITCKVESIAEHVQWSFPPGCNFTSLVTIEATPQLDAMSPV